MPWSAPIDPSVMRFTAQPTQHLPPATPLIQSAFTQEIPPMQPMFSQTTGPIQPVFPQTTQSLQTMYNPVRSAVINEMVGFPPVPKWKFPLVNGTVSSAKRRNSSSDEDDTDIDQPPSKVHAGADRVAAKLCHLDIDSDDDGPVVEELNDDSQEFEGDMRENNQGIVHLSDEVKTVLASNPSNTLNQLLQEEREKNKRALVLWTPPRNILQPVVEDSDDEDLSPGITITEIFDDDDRMEI